MSVRRSAVAEGVSDFWASFSRMKKSMALRSASTPASVANAATRSGTGGFTIGCQAQWSSRGSRTAADASSSEPGQGAPASIQAVMAATSSFDSCSPSGGIICSGFVVVIRRTSSLVVAFPATAAGPKSPPLSMAARESSRRFDSWASAPWHSTQRAARIARAGACASCASSAAACGPPPAAPYTASRLTKTSDRCGQVIDGPPQKYEPPEARLALSTSPRTPPYSSTANSGESRIAWQSSSSAVSGFGGLAGSAKSVRASHRRGMPGMLGISIPGIRMLGDHR